MPFLEAVKQVDRQQPFMNRDMRALHDGAGAGGELVAAIVAQEHSGLRFAAHARERY